MNVEIRKQSVVSNDLPDDGQIGQLSFEDTLKQMRARRYSTVQRQLSRDSNEPLSMPTLNESTSGFSHASSISMEDSQSERGAYWRRIGEERRNPSYGIKPICSKSPAPEGFDWEILAKLPEALFAGGSTASCSNKPAVDYGGFEKEMKRLEYTDEAVSDLMNDKEFRRLQRSLRHKGAVTNEFLKQVLPLVVKQTQERKKRKSRTRQHSS